MSNMLDKKMIKLIDTDIKMCERILNSYRQVHNLRSSRRYIESIVSDLNDVNGSKFKYTIKESSVKLYDENITEVMNLLVAENINTQELLDEFITHGNIPKYLSLSILKNGDDVGISIGVNLDVKGKIK